MTDVLDATDRVVTIVNPLEIRTETLGNNRMNMVAYAWLPMVEDENIMYLHQQHIVGMAHANEDMQEYYVDALQRILHPEDLRKQEREELLDLIKEFANTNTQSYH